MLNEDNNNKTTTSFGEKQEYNVSQELYVHYK